MKRKLLSTLTLLLCVCSGAWATDYTWTFDTYASTMSAGKDGKKMVDSDGEVEVSSNNGVILKYKASTKCLIYQPTSSFEIGGTSYNTYIYMGGNGSTSARYFQTASNLTGKYQVTIAYHSTYGAGNCDIYVGSTKKATTTASKGEAVTSAVVDFGTGEGNYLKICHDTKSAIACIMLKQLTKPYISTQPISAVYALNETPATLSVTAVSSTASDPTYQWYSNTTEAATIDAEHQLSGETNSTYTPSTAEAGTKYYYCVVTDGNGSTTSNIASITVSAASAPTELTIAATATEVIKGNTVTLSVSSVDGAPVPTIAWYSNTTASNSGGIDTGEMGNSFTPSVSTIGTFYYYAVATNASGSVASNVITLVVKSKYATPTNTLDFSTPATASDLLNVTWTPDRPFFGNDNTNNYMVFSAYSANNSKNKGDITWVGFYNESGKTTGGSADKVAWSATGVFKGSGAYTQSDSKAYISTSNTNRPYTYYTYRVKGISKVQSLVNPNGSSSIVTMNAFPITAGVPSEIADDSDASTTSNLDEVLEIDGLNTSTEYLITFESNNTSNIKILEIAFFYPEENQVYETIATLAERNYATYVTTNALDFSAASNIAAYIATGLNVGETAVVIEAVDEVPANEPILVKTASKGASVNVPVATSTVDALGSNLFVKGDGTTSVTESDGYYYLASDLFHLANTGTLQTGKAYLHITAPGARQLSIGFGDDSEPTGIQTICNEEKGVLNGEFYNIAGQRVALPQKGLYIVNGHKVVVK